MKKKKTVITITSVLMLSSLFVGCSSKEKDAILNHLQNKYNQEFIIESYTKDKSNIKDTNSLEAIVYPKNNYDLLFNVEKEKSEEEIYNDNYGFIKMSKFLKGSLRETVRFNAGNNILYKVTINSTEEDINEKIVEMIPEEFIAVTSNANKLDMGFELAIEVKDKKEVTNYYEGILNILNHIASYDTGFYKLSIGFVTDLESTKDYLRENNIYNGKWEDVEENLLATLVVDKNDFINNIDKLSEKIEFKK